MRAPKMAASLRAWRRTLESKHFAQFIRFQPVTVYPCRSVITGNPQTDKTISDLTGGRAEKWLHSYEDFVGLTDVRGAQYKVIEGEKQFLQAQTNRREKQEEMTQIQNELQVLNKQLEKLHRGDERYLELVQQEVEIIKRRDNVGLVLTSMEKKEKETFTELSSAVRESHEKERARAERTKYWSIIGSAVGALIGIIGTTINNYRRMKELRGIVKDSAGSGTELKGSVVQLSQLLDKQENRMNSFVTELKGLVTQDEGVTNTATKPRVTSLSDEDMKTASSGQLAKQTKEIMDFIKQQDVRLSEDMNHLKEVLATATTKDPEGNVLYTNPDIAVLIKETERNLEQKLKNNSVWIVTFIYGAFALSVPALYYLFKGT